MGRRVACLLALVALVHLVAGELQEDGELVLHLHHSLDMGSTWSERGSVAVHSTRSGSASVEQNSLDSDQVEALSSLCQGGGGLYLVKATQSGGPTLRSYTPACGLLEAGLQDTLTLQLDWRGKLVAAIMGVQQVAPRKGVEAQPTTFKTKISTQQMENGPAPDTAAFIQRMEENKRKEEKGEVKDNRSFLAKYWMYIVPVVLFMALNGAAAPQQ